ncbi:MAG: hypothetical protein P4L58_01160, partial [Candidatus Pacebacteria bacterium]|nr:hypothetical protein [Candidatus Paceibacterota bacterium]
MKLNAFLWNNFIDSPKGRGWIDFFSSLGGRYEQGDEKLAGFISEWASHGTLDQADAKDEMAGVLDALKELRQAMKDGLLPPAVESWEQAESYFRT